MRHLYPLISLVFPIASLAQSDSLLADGFDNIDLQECVVTATRTPKRLAEVPVITNVVTAKEIECINATTINNVLEATIPGIEFTTAMNGTQVINFQGMGGNDILFLIDGERLAGETLNNIDFDRININNIERIEYVKGASSAMYGSNAIGGVINIITKEAKSPLTITANARYSKYNSLNTGASISTNKRKLKSVSTISYKRKDTYDLTGTQSSSSKYENRIYGGNNKSVSEKLTFNPIDALSITARGTYYRRLRDYHSYQGYDHRFQDIAGGIEANYTPDSSNTVTASYHADSYWKDVLYVDYDLPNERKYENNQHTAKLHYSHAFPHEGTLSFGVEHLYEYMLNDQFEVNLHKYVEDNFAHLIPFTDYTVELASGTLYDRHRAHTTSAYIQHDIPLGRVFTLLYALRLDNHTAFGAHLSPKANLMWKIKHLNARASYSSGFRTPTLKEMYSDYDMGGLGMFRIIGNPNLRPETSHNISASIEYRRGKGCATIEAYRLNKKDYIDLVYNAAGDSCFYINTAKMTVSGINAHASCTFSRLFKAELAYSYVNDRYQNVAFSKSRPHSGTASLTYSLPKRKRYALSATINGKVKCGYYALSFDTQGNQTASDYYPAYTLWSLNTRHSIGSRLIVTAGADNLFNYKPKTYSNVASVFTQGIEPHIGLELKISK